MGGQQQGGREGEGGRGILRVGVHSQRGGGSGGSGKLRTQHGWKGGGWLVWPIAVLHWVCLSLRSSFNRRAPKGPPGGHGFSSHLGSHVILFDFLCSATSDGCASRRGGPFTGCLHGAR